MHYLDELKECHSILCFRKKIKKVLPSWWHSIVVRPPVLASELSLSCAGLTADRVTTWKASAISQPTWPTQPAISLGSVK